jgi:hypothetical protein
VILLDIKEGIVRHKWMLLSMEVKVDYTDIMYECVLTGAIKKVRHFYNKYHSLTRTEEEWIQDGQVLPKSEVGV